MTNLEKIMYYFIKKFPHTLGRTMLIKAIYLLDCEWSRSFGTTYTDLEYKRDYNGPFDTQFYEAKNNLCQLHLIHEIPYQHPTGIGYEYVLINDDPKIESEINSIALGIADEIISKLSYKSLDEFKRMAYNTEPMLDILNNEQGGIRFYGRALNMSKNKNTPSPLFDFDEIREIAKSLNQERRGSDEEYNRIIMEEMNELSVYRERVEKICQLVERE